MQKRQRQLRVSNLEALESRLLLSATVNEVEPNNRVAQQFTVPEDGLVHILGNTDGRNDKDFFSFVAPATGPLAISVATPNGGLVQLEIEKSNSAHVFETEPNDGVNQGTAQLQAGQTYVIRLRSKSKSGSPAYDVTLQFTGGSNGGGGGGGGTADTIQESESNNSKSTANPFAFPQTNTLTLQGVSTSKRDSDYFAFTATANGTIQASVHATGARVQLEVETSGSVQIFETEPNDGNNSGSFQVQQGVKYFIRLRSKSDASGTYLTDLAFTPASV